MQKNNQTIVLGGGCFWCMEAVLSALQGVISVTPGYAGGTSINPTYYAVANKKTGHAEVVRVEFDPTIISLRDLLDIFFHSHDPTSLNKQDYDEGPEYRSIILYSTEDQKQIIDDLLSEYMSSGEFTKTVVTEIHKLDTFYEAEKEHINYFEKNSYLPYCQIIISPKIAKLKQHYAKRLKVPIS